MRSVMPAFFTAAIESPPPTIVVPCTDATARATALVPAANASISNTPIGPFQTTVLASPSSVCVRADRRSTDVDAHAIADRGSSTSSISLAPRASSLVRHDVIDRQRELNVRAVRLGPRWLARASSLSSSTSDLPTGTPRDLKNV